MGLSDPTNKDIMREIEKLRDALEEVSKRTRPLSPEHVAQAIGYLDIKGELEQIKLCLAQIVAKMGTAGR